LVDHLPNRGLNLRHVLADHVIQGGRFDQFEQFGLLVAYQVVQIAALGAMDDYSRDQSHGDGEQAEPKQQLRPEIDSLGRCGFQQVWFCLGQCHALCVPV
jgi:hypothetical protein